MKFLKQLNKDWQILVLAGVVSFGFVAVINWSPHSETKSKDSVDTLIPAGYILIPIEVQNYESLDSLLGQYGIVDLFKGDGRDGKLVAKNIRILRAPLNPSHFAVLAPESEASAILAQAGNFYVAIKSPNQLGTQIVTKEKHIKRVYFDGE
jgi:hypothetical protein